MYTVVYVNYSKDDEHDKKCFNSYVPSLQEKVFFKDWGTMKVDSRKFRPEENLFIIGLVEH